MKRELAGFILSVVILLVVGYGVVAPSVSKKENTKTTVTQKVEKPKSKKEVQQEKVEYARTPSRGIEKSWAREYDIYSLKDVNIKK